jgi:hypothetical protein
MSTTLDDTLTQYHWTPQPAAAALVRELVEQFCERNTFAAQLTADMRDKTGTRFIDWVDHIAVPRAVANRERWVEVGFEVTTIDGDECYVHRGGIFPTLLVSDDNVLQLSILVESVADFAAVHGFDNIEGEPAAPYRRLMVSEENETKFYVIERHGYLGFRIQPITPAMSALIAKHREIFRTRRRTAESEEAAFAYTGKLIDDAIAEIGQDRACDLFFAAEREYWQRRNRAGRIQYARQAELGLGWGNDDHHTYRSSRQHFQRLIALFEKLGFYCRERFYAGRDAGWGAQVLEHPTTEIVIFADVDMSPDELRGDFSHEGLEPRQTLGTIGLWCALHGESILEAGMHHLECTFDYALLRDQLADSHIETMDPFTSFSYLKQAFTRGEVWHVRPKRIDALLAAGQITEEQAAQFRAHGAIGSHLENLERNDGFKGFNQEGVSEIITGTDPRRHLIHAGA